jgi:hypothetical protein
MISERIVMQRAADGTGLSVPGVSQPSTMRRYAVAKPVQETRYLAPTPKPASTGRVVIDAGVWQASRD